MTALDTALDDLQHALERVNVAHQRGLVPPLLAKALRLTASAGSTHTVGEQPLTDPATTTSEQPE